MTSINTNTSAMAALQTLRGINSNLEKTQGQVSSGLRVGSASDNAAYWSIATTMRSDNDANSAISDALGLGAATADTAYQGMNSAIDLVTQIQSKLVAAQAEGVDKSKVQGDISQLQSQLKSIVNAASFSGENWLQGDPSQNVNKSVLGSFVRDSSGNVSVKSIDYTLDGSSVLIDSSGGNGGILDKTYNVQQSSITLSIDTDTTDTTAAKDYTLKVYSAADLALKNQTVNSDPTLTGPADTDTTFTDGTDTYVKYQNNWVKADTSGTNANQSALVTIGGTAYVADTTDTWSSTNTEAAPTSLLTMDITKATDQGSMDTMLKAVDAALTDMTSAAASLGSISQRIDLQTDFVSKLSDSVSSGIGKLVDADMEQESSKLTALQTQQQLAIQSLSIANSSSQNILSLFRG